ncbi:MAG: CHRD domain-containing protein [Candidatus Eisenbacteria bacterium]
MKRLGIFTAVVAVLSIGLASLSTSAGRPFRTQLTGEAEVGGGDSDGSGVAELTLNPGRGEICFKLTVSDIEAANAAHIHVGVAGQNGPAVVGLEAPADGTSDGCIAVDRDLVLRIMQNPDSFYVNIHNVPFPNGALRGQLGR